MIVRIYSKEKRIQQLQIFEKKLIGNNVSKRISTVVKNI